MGNANRRPDKQISRDEIRTALLRSGYLTEGRVADLLRTIDWYVVQNPAYPDPTSGRSRELDIYSRDLSQESFGGFQQNSVWAEILVECVNPPNPLVFFIQGQKEHFEESAWLQCMRLLAAPLHVATTDVAQNWRGLLPHLDLEERHHYGKGAVATQFCSFERKKDKEGAWYATHRDTDHDSIVGLCHGVEHFTRNFYRTDDIDRFPERLNLAVLYPVIVVSGSLMLATPSRRSVHLRSVQHVKYLRTLMLGGLAHSYMIDVVTESHFPTYVELLRQDSKTLAGALDAKWPILGNILAMHQASYEEGLAKGLYPRPPAIP